MQGWEQIIWNKKTKNRKVEEGGYSGYVEIEIEEEQNNCLERIRQAGERSKEEVKTNN